MSDNNDDDYHDENRERREAEFEFVRAAYSRDEAWVVVGEGDNDANDARIHRRLDLPIGDSGAVSSDNSGSGSGSVIPIELILTLPPSYPSDDDSPLLVDATVVGNSSNGGGGGTNPGSYRKLAMDALPSLLEACRNIALETAGTESVFVVLSRADEWIDEDWSRLLLLLLRNESIAAAAAAATIAGVDSPAERNARSNNNSSNNNNNNNTAPSVLGRKLIYSHHIIAKSKRKAISDLAKDYTLGGYYKIGWPGIIVIEGEEEDCNLFCDEIRRMRWQHLVVRGEERESLREGLFASLDDLRRFPLEMTELGEDQMSRLSELCREAGLEDLFKTSMKIYGTNDNNNNNSTTNDNNNVNINNVNNADQGSVPESKPRYGTLIWVDHMNDPRGYTKWIRKACQSTGCSCAILRHVPGSEGENDAPSLSCHNSNAIIINNNNNHNHNNNNNNNNSNSNGGSRPLIVVGLHADEAIPVKQVLKRWRTSKVDVDARGVPCLERKMDVLVEGELPLPLPLPLPLLLPSTKGPRDDRGHDDRGGGGSGGSGGGSASVSAESNVWTVKGSDRMTLSEMECLVDSIGGTVWREAFRGVIESRCRNGGNHHDPSTRTNKR